MVEYLKNPLYLTWVITNRCNLRCKFCYLEDYVGSDLTIEETDKVLNIIKEKQFVHISILGGEPTEFKYFNYVLSKLEELQVSYAFSTNAQKISKNEKLLDILSASKCLREVQVSLESPVSAINDLVRGKKSYDRAIEGIKTMAARNIPVRIAMVLTKKNKHTVQEMAYLASELGAKELRLMPFVPIGTGYSSKEQLFMNYEELVNTCTNIKVPSKLKVTTYLKENESQNHKKTLGCGAGTAVCVMNNDLTISACPLMAQWEKSKRKAVDVDSFDTIWKESSIFDTWRYGAFRKKTSCNLCPLFAECGGYS